MGIKFLLDENIAISVLKYLRKEGYEVRDLKEEKLFGIDDIEIIKMAYREERIIITHDKDFIELSKINKHHGILLFRLPKQSPENVIKRLDYILNSNIKNKLKKVIIVLDDYLRIVG